MRPALAKAAVAGAIFSGALVVMTASPASAAPGNRLIQIDLGPIFGSNPLLDDSIKLF